MNETDGLKCWHCGAEPDLPEGKVSFQAVCDKCSSWLHCCKGCRFYKPGQANDCLIPDTEHVPDRSARNFCDEFKALSDAGPVAPKKTAADAARELFGDGADEEENDQDNPFDRLFKD